MANKKITELPFIDTISGSSVFDNPILNTVVPVVMYGTTNQITIENYAKFINLYSAHTGSAGNTFTGPQTINNNVTINGRLTVHEIVAQYETSSILFSTGSTKLGDQLTDKHEFTGSTNITGALYYNDVLVTNIDSNTVERLQQATASLQTQTGSQDLVNLGISTYTGSQNVINTSVDSHILTQATQTGSQDLVNNQNAIVTSSFRAEIGGIEAYTASLKGQAIVSSSTQITNYHKFAETASANTFYGNQSITGSLSISNGQFNIITGSGELTSSLSFRHTTIDPITGNATLELRYRNNDVGPENNAWKFMASDSGVALVFEQEGVDRTLLSSNNAGDALIFRDTRLFGKGLTVDNNLLVSQNTQITGSLIVMGGITGSILATNRVVSSSNQLFELNQQTGSQNSINFNISVVTSSIDAHILKQATQTGSQDLVNYNISVVTSSIDAHILKQATQTGSQDLVNFNISVVTSSIDAHILGISTYTASANTTNTSIDAHILAQSIQTASQDLVNYNISVVTSSIDAHILKQATQTGSQDLVNLGISSVTGSLIGITNGLMAFTSALDNTYATDAQLYQLYQATASIQFTTASLNTQTGSQSNLNAQIGIATSSLNSVSASLIGITNGLMAFTAALDSTYATDAQLYQLYQATASIQFTTASLNIQTGSQDLVNYNISIVTSSIDAHILKQAIQTGSQDLVNLGISTYTGSQNVINSSVDSHIIKQATQTGSQDLVNLGISTFTGSLRTEVNLIEAYTASLKGAIEVSGQNVNVLGMITAQQFNVTYVSSSVMYQSGSNKFGNSNDDKHEFTGSVDITGGSGALIAITATTADTAGSARLRVASTGGNVNDFISYSDSHPLRANQAWIGGDANTKITVLQAAGTEFLRGTFGASTSVTASGNLQLGGNLSINGGNSVRLYESTNTNYWDVYTYTDNTLRVNYKGAGGDEIILYNDGGINFSGAVTASGNVSVGASSFTSPGGADKFIGVFSGQDSSIILQDSVETWEMYMNDDLYFTTGSTNPKNVMSLRRVTGNVEINEGNLVIGKAGKGIDFSITSNGSGTTSSELLNDYEEGTWTPVLSSAGGTPTGTTYTDRNATYTKVGRAVTVTGGFLLSSKGTGGSGETQISGLPFTQRSTGAYGEGTASVTVGSLTTAALASRVDLFTVSGGSYLRLRLDQTDAELDFTEITNTTYIKFTCTYFV